MGSGSRSLSEPRAGSSSNVPSSVAAGLLPAASSPHFRPSRPLAAALSVQGLFCARTSSVVVRSCKTFRIVLLEGPSSARGEGPTTDCQRVLPARHAHQAL